MLVRRSLESFGVPADMISSQLLAEGWLANVSLLVADTCRVALVNRSGKLLAKLGALTLSSATSHSPPAMIALLIVVIAGALI